MSAHENTPLASILCVGLIVAGFALHLATFEWPTSRIVRSGHTISGNDIMVHDVLPIVAIGYAIGLGAIAITRFIFPKSDIRTILLVVGACAVLVGLPFLMLAVAISGTPTERDFGTLAMLFAVPLAIATWAGISRYRTRQEAN